ncbi:unnamed protein product [Didymodactylos carnosus]|uniref:Right handed beta helix domain-containing protein n=1 Tax=Didymodactylos carnosus TaxID=1234261 RepID=A0A814L8E5_9BILA|nr:unnamed protein product [Didymodactylos carnosus]CAF1061558.1 unnamed protein product [Didymodactylos carnosus]CAF3599606.1 unnamed protein product [Didymodactylos carnosus]CAF3829809.1 unnamed protein product [Didymodactylos carnosus]
MSRPAGRLGWRRCYTGPRHGRVDNPNVVLKDDCALRAFTIEMATYIAPSFWKSNWTALSESAFQMSECYETTHHAYESSRATKSFETAQKIKKGICHRTVFVRSVTGHDLFDGTFERPMKTIQAALSLTRTLRTVHSSDHTLCITIRGGTYYLGTNASTTSSQIGAIVLTSNDSNLVIENYQDERVVLSGGALLQLQWSVHAKTAVDGTIMKAQIPSYIKLDQFNELYIDSKRAIVAKYPNGDPSTQGLYAKDPGFSFDAQRWWPPSFNRSVEIHVQEPYRNGTVFTNYQLGLGGGASVFNPPTNFWSTAAPPAGDNYVVPRGLTVKNGTLLHIGSWSNPTTGFVHAFHAGYWGSWVFEIASINSTENTIVFGRGGFQEARGSSDGGAYYVANIFEELDSPNEWFLNKDTRTLYFMPNETMPQVFVASQIPCLISMSGSSMEDAVNNVLIQGLILTETSSTYMRDYMVPGGGDWAVHRGGTIYLTNTKNVTITHNLFTQLGSNGVALIDHNVATSITLSEFVWLADSAIILVGSTNGIDGFSVASQPDNTLIQSNLIHETGIYIKQSSPVLIAVSRSVSVVGNLMFNTPRAAINVNDGYYGNHTVSWNVMFNTVRETSDHGPINTWDRQPFLSDAVQPGLPSLWQHQSYIHHNVLFNNYNALWPIDHDDGSCFYEDSYNFHVYGGKKNFLGHSKIDHHQIYVYPDANKGDFGSNNPVPYVIGNCDTANLFVPYLANNKIYIPSGAQVVFTCNVNGTSTQPSLEQWQSYDLDIGTTVQTTPDVQTIIQWGREMLQTTTQEDLSSRKK